MHTTATHSNNTLQHTATHCNTCTCIDTSLQRMRVLHSAHHCNTLQHTAANVPELTRCHHGGGRCTPRLLVSAYLCGCICMCVGVGVCIYVWLHLYVCRYLCLHICVVAFELCMYTHVFMSVCMFVCVCVGICVCIYVWLHLSCVCIRTYL